ncbi:nucleopolyhedrovirus P10 family protein [Streptomyces griseoviridis]|uniref:Nucleopolyhedrovirus P10 family protein n=1 Tax=Streptomyces hintoniae TaxID=3075521 RepID=A0ABU2UFR6_9ACTN|nr:nucleopolyhedrovirus P10 family protein [Streptomyces sp. DSM 41014]MDT0472003.1 nucleopolyhedrovirus P10 family protein [Streptomyces sp. DSM 41014]
MTADWTRAVREQLGLGRLLPLGGARDGAWISEAAAEAVLRRAAGEVRGVRLGRLRLALADEEGAPEPVVPAPPSGLRPGPLALTAEFTATAAQPLPAAAERLRAALAGAAVSRLGLRLAAVDLRVTALLDEEPNPAPADPPAPPRMDRSGDADENKAARAAESVPGVAAVTRSLDQGVRIEERQATGGAGSGGGALAGRHARVEITVTADHRAVEVARQVRAAVAAALPDHPTVAVLVTSVG